MFLLYWPALTKINLFPLFLPPTMNIFYSFIVLPSQLPKTHAYLVSVWDLNHKFCLCSTLCLSLDYFTHLVVGWCSFFAFCLCCDLKWWNIFLFWYFKTEVVFIYLFTGVFLYILSRIFLCMLLHWHFSSVGFDCLRELVFYSEIMVLTGHCLHSQNMWYLQYYLK